MTDETATAAGDDGFEWKPDICIYHANCADGFGAAWAVWKRWGDAVTFMPASYGDEPPTCDGKKVLLVDFSYKSDVISGMSRRADSIIVLDHHKTAEAELARFNHVVAGSAGNVARLFAKVRGPEQNVLVEFNMKRSGAALAWRFCSDAPIPALLCYVEDRDLWLFRLDQSREVAAFVRSHPFDFATWDNLSIMSPIDMAAQGASILRNHDREIADALQASTRRMVIGGHQVDVANVPYTMASDAGNILARNSPFSFAATYFDRADGTRAFSLRSSPEGSDVSAIAATYGGGGHKHAAGFQMPCGWEGDANG